MISMNLRMYEISSFFGFSMYSSSTLSVGIVASDKIVEKVV